MSIHSTADANAAPSATNFPESRHFVAIAIADCQRASGSAYLPG